MPKIVSIFNCAKVMLKLLQFFLWKQCDIEYMKKTNATRLTAWTDRTAHAL